MAAIVVADTNVLLMPFERKVPIEAELERLLGPYELVVPSACRRELERIARDERGARRDRARMALQWSARFRTVEGEPPADVAALRLAKELRAHLFTNDAALIRLARSQDVPIVRLKGLSHLVRDPMDAE